jgi:hypothetical protein
VHISTASKKRRKMMGTPHELYYDEDRYRQRNEDVMHPRCEECGKYIFAVDGCKGHGDEERTDEND